MNWQMDKSPSPSGRGQGEGLKIRKDFSLGFALSGSRFARPSPGAPARWLSLRPLPEGEGLLPDASDPYVISHRGSNGTIVLQTASGSSIALLPGAKSISLLRRKYS